MRRSSFGLTILSLAFLAGSASADPPAASSTSTRLDYQRAAGAEACPDADTWRDALVSKIEGAADPFNTTGPNVLRVTMQRRPKDYRATFELFDAAGRSQGMREQTSVTCPEAARALAISASLLFIRRAPTPTPTTAPTTTTPPPRAVPPPILPPPVASDRRRWFVQVGAGGGAVAGFSPFIAPAFGGFLGFRFPLGEGPDAPAFAISIEGRADLEAATGPISGPQGQTAVVRAAFAGGTLAPCMHGGRWFLGCVLLTFGDVRTSLGPDVTPSGQGSLFVGIGGRAGAEIPLLHGRPTLAIRVALDGWVSAARPEVRIGGAPVWTAPQGAGALGAYLVALF